MTMGRSSGLCSCDMSASACLASASETEKDGFTGVFAQPVTMTAQPMRITATPRMAEFGCIDASFALLRASPALLANMPALPYPSPLPFYHVRGTDHLK